MPGEFERWRRVLRIDLQNRTTEAADGVVIPLKPFFGSMGVAPEAGAGRISTVPPGNYAGNLDNKDLGAGTILYIPVHTRGALFSAGDGHGVQGHGEVSGTALETGLRGRFQFFVRKDMKLAAIIHKFGVSVDFLRKFRAESVFRCDYKASKLVEPNRGEARAPSGNSSARRGLYICVGAGSQGTVRWDTDGASVMRRAFVRDKTMPGAPRCDEKFPEPGHRF